MHIVFDASIYYLYMVENIILNMTLNKTSLSVIYSEFMISYLFSLNILTPLE